jgi:hypothetical protein
MKNACKIFLLITALLPWISLAYVMGDSHHCFEGYGGVMSYGGSYGGQPPLFRVMGDSHHCFENYVT